MSDLERYIRENWSYMCPSERLFALMDLAEEKGLVEPTTNDEWMMWAIPTKK